MTLIIFLIVGLLAGWAASIITGSHEGLVGDLITGVIGSFLAGTIVQLLTTGTFDLTSSISGINITSIIVSIIGAVALTYIVKAFRGKSLK